MHEDEGLSHVYVDPLNTDFPSPGIRVPCLAWHRRGENVCLLADRMCKGRELFFSCRFSLDFVLKQSVRAGYLGWCTLSFPGAAVFHLSRRRMLKISLSDVQTNITHKNIFTWSISILKEKLQTKRNGDFSPRILFHWPTHLLLLCEQKD